MAIKERFLVRARPSKALRHSGVCLKVTSQTGPVRCHDKVDIGILCHGGADVQISM